MTHLAFFVAVVAAALLWSVNLIQANLPPVVTDAANAASLYEPAFAALEADPIAKAQESPLNNAASIERLLSRFL
jgi:hypothetical protein